MCNAEPTSYQSLMVPGWSSNPGCTRDEAGQPRVPGAVMRIAGVDHVIVINDPAGDHVGTTACADMADMNEAMMLERRSNPVRKARISLPVGRSRPAGRPFTTLGRRNSRVRWLGWASHSEVSRICRLSEFTPSDRCLCAGRYGRLTQVSHSRRGWCFYWCGNPPDAPADRHPEGRQRAYLRVRGAVRAGTGRRRQDQPNCAAPVAIWSAPCSLAPTSASRWC